MIKNEQKKRIITRVVFKGLELDSLEFLMKQNNINEVNSFLRFLVQKEYNQTKNSLLRYGKGGEGGSKKPTMKDKIEEIRSMSIPELEGYIFQVGLLQNYQDADNHITYHVVNKPGEEGEIKVVCEFRKSEDSNEKPFYVSDTYMNRDEIINALKKDKLI